MTDAQLAIDDVEIAISGLWLAPAWLSVVLAASSEAKDLQLYRSAEIEFHPTGIRVTATDRYMLLTCWVPAVGEEDTRPPGIDESPLRTVVVRDTAGRGAGLMQYVRKELLAEDQPPEEAPEVVLSLDKAEGGHWRGAHTLALDGLDQEALAIEVPDRERVRLPLFEGEWVPWRVLATDWIGRDTAAMAFRPSIMGRLARLGPLHADADLAYYWGGPESAARVAIGSPPLEVTGLVMPVRWRYGEPKPDAEPEDPGEEDDDDGYDDSSFDPDQF